MRKFSLFLPVLALFAATLAAPLDATPALGGSSGLIRIPTAYTLNRGEIDAAADVHFFKRVGGANDIRFVNTRVVAGLFDSADYGAEIGVHRVDIDNYSGSGTAVTAKYRFPGLLPLGAFAFGGRFNVGGQEQNSVYAVGSTNAAKTFAVHYGVGVNFDDARGLFNQYGGKQSNLDSDRIFAMFGAELDLGDFKLDADYNGDSVAYGVDWYPMDSIAARVFWLDKGNLERTLGGHYSLGFGLTLQF